MAFSTIETGHRTRITIENLDLIEIKNKNMGKFEYAIKVRIKSLPESERGAVLRLKRERNREWYFMVTRVQRKKELMTTWDQWRSWGGGEGSLHRVPPI
ncbi:hypothetical protein EVAR_65072_1 [Eumeta japonica]|uniref:Uncharacterized protein n=1 Tax=Eumeta variegata TaxID=151549 RepID=A0A4C1ZQC1_EUMVA|nr:hypothetical protein EVAR_65072_1 [Eumeta japonica]